MFARVTYTAESLAPRHALGVPSAGVASRARLMPGHSPLPRRGLTLVEALLVLVVVAILIAIALPRYQSMRERAVTAAMRGDLLALRVAEEAYFAEHRRYAATLSELNFAPTTPGVSISLVAPDPSSGWSATATSTLSPASGSCFLGGGTGEAGAAPSSGGVQCNSFVFESQARQQP